MEQFDIVEIPNMLGAIEMAGLLGIQRGYFPYIFFEDLGDCSVKVY